MKPALFISALSFALITSTAALADHHGAKKFEKLDANSDGVVTLDEHSAHAAERFKRMDANGDGKVTKEEAKAHHSDKKAKWKELKEKKKARDEATY